LIYLKNISPLEKIRGCGGGECPLALSLSGIKGNCCSK